MDDLYKNFILEHYRNPHQRKRLDKFEVTCHLKNPYCGDEIEIFIRRNEKKTIEYFFWNKSCVLLQASASMLMRAIEMNDVAHFSLWKEQFEKLLSKQSDQEKLDAMPKEFYNFKSFYRSNRKKCILLPWKALALALEKFHKKECD